jgi:hypothetical protein
MDLIKERLMKKECRFGPHHIYYYHLGAHLKIYMIFLLDQNWMANGKNDASVQLFEIGVLDDTLTPK